jgi:Family of unknown function (DUF5681)
MNTPSKPDYDVGYGRPPEHSKWKKGQCGNPNRRRKREPKPVATLIDEFFAREIDFVENGISHRRSAFEIILLQLYNKATTGNSRALNVLKKYSDFAASRDPSGGMRVVLNNDKYEYLARRQGPGEKNG